MFSIEKRPVIYTVVKAKNHRAARKIGSMYLKKLWNALRFCWLHVNVALSDMVAHDIGKNFLSIAHQSR